MEVERTARNFEIINFKDRYDKSCTLQRSSLADDQCIWLGVDDAEPQIMASKAPFFGIQTEERTGWIPYPIPLEVSLNTRMHLNREQVAALLPHLQKFAETGEIE